MTTYFVDSSVADDTGDGSSWATAKKYLASAVALATGDGDVIKVHSGHLEILAAAATYTFLNNVNVICVDKNNSDALAEMDGTTGYIGHTTSAYFVQTAGAYRCYIRGLAFVVGGTGNVTQQLARTDGSHHVFDRCIFDLNTGAASCISLGGFNNMNSYCELRNSTIRFDAAGQYLLFGSGRALLENVTIAAAGSAPTTLISAANYSAGDILFRGCDLSKCTGTLLASQATKHLVVTMENCKLGTGVTPLATQTPANLSSGEIWLFNCDSGDQQYRIAHHNAFGSTTVTSAIYANDGAQYDGTNRCSWVVSGTAAATIYTPYKSPWIDKYHAGSSAITPYLECMRDNSSGAVFQNNAVWSEWSYQGNSASTQAKYADDRMTLLGTPADQTASSKTASDWTGETGTPGLFKLDAGSPITPAEIGHLRARICVAGAQTVYVDPTLRGTA